MATETETKSHIFDSCGGEVDLCEGVVLRILAETFKTETRVEWTVLPKETNDVTNNDVISCFPAIDLVAMETETEEEVELFDRHAQIIYRGANQGNTESDCDIEADLEYIPHHHHGNSHHDNDHPGNSHPDNGHQAKKPDRHVHIPRQEVDPMRPEAVSLFHTYYCVTGSDVIIYTRHFSRFKLCCPQHGKNKTYESHLAARLFWKRITRNETDGPKVTVDLKVILDIKHLPLTHEYPEDWPIADYESYNLVDDPVDLPTPDLVEPTTSFDCSVTLPDGSGWKTKGNCYKQPRELGSLELCWECHNHQDHKRPEAALFQFKSISTNPGVLCPELDFTITKPRSKEGPWGKAQSVVLYNPEPHLATTLSQVEEEMDTIPYQEKSSGQGIPGSDLDGGARVGPGQQVPGHNIHPGLAAPNALHNTSPAAPPRHFRQDQETLAQELPTYTPAPPGLDPTQPQQQAFEAVEGEQPYQQDNPSLVVSQRGKQLKDSQMFSLAGELTDDSDIMKLAVHLGAESTWRQCKKNVPGDRQAQVYDFLKRWYQTQNSPEEAYTNLWNTLRHPLVQFNQMAAKYLDGPPDSPPEGDIGGSMTPAPHIG